MPLGVQKLFAATGSCKRGICIWLAFAIVLILAFFPPWVGIVKIGERTGQRINLGHALYSHDPHEWNRWEPQEVNYPRMLTEIAVGECFVLALSLTWARRKGE